MLIIEDVHWVRRCQLEFLAFLARRLEKMRFLLLLTYRDDGSTRGTGAISGAA